MIMKNEETTVVVESRKIKKKRKEKKTKDNIEAILNHPSSVLC